MTSERDPKRGGELCLRIAAVAAGGWAMAQFSRDALTFPGAGPAVWLPAGWNLLAMLWGGVAMWPGVWFGRLTDVLWTKALAGGPWLSARGVAEAATVAWGSTLQALLGLWLVWKWLGTDRFLDHSGHVFRFAAVAALTAPVSATVLTLTPAAFTGVALSDTLKGWGGEWCMRMVGLLLVAPFAAATRRDPFAAQRRRRMLEAVTWIAGLLFMTELVFGPWVPPQMPLSFLILPLIVLASFRLGALELLTLLLVVTLNVARRTAQGYGPFAGPSPDIPRLVMQVFGGTTAVTALALNAEVRDRRRAHEALKHERDFTSTIQEVIGALVVVLDREGRIVRFNRACEQTTGYRAEEVLGKPFWDLFLIPEEAPEVKAVFQSLRAGHFPLNHENYWLTRGGDRRWIAWSNTCLPGADGGVEYVIGTGIDLTERRQAEEAVRRLNTELEQRVRDRTAELEAANRELESFSFSVSHDLRAPLRAMDGFSQALAEDYAARLDGKAREYLDRIRAAARRMGEVIDDLLQLSRAMRAEMKRERLDLSAMARGILAELRQSEPDRSVTADIRDGVLARGDPVLMELVVRNLLQNAWKFTARVPHARLELGMSRVDRLPRAPGGGACPVPEGVPPDHMAYYVRDNGAGFDMAYVNRLFKPFQRLHTQQEYPGSGVGLATVERIVRRHGGRVWAVGHVGEGAMFCFTLSEPAKTAPGKEETDASETATDPSRRGQSG